MASVLRDIAAGPGRVCPLSYRYSPRSLDRAPELAAETLYVVGGLYGNVEAAHALGELAARERGPVSIVFNGDFHWFDVDREDFAAIAESVRPHRALRGNVETEIAGEDSGAGCGCAYPFDVSDAEVRYSNEILHRLRETARSMSPERERLGALPMSLVAMVGEARIAIVHGDAGSLAGWGFAHDRLDDPARRRWIEDVFTQSRVDVFASTHTCLPAFRRFDLPGRAGIVANNGAAGMPNFEATRFGIVTRISTRPAATRLMGHVVRGVHVDAVPLVYDHGRWTARFLRAWPEGSAAHASYWRRIERGPHFAMPRAEPRLLVS